MVSSDTAGIIAGSLIGGFITLGLVALLTARCAVVQRQKDLARRSSVLVSPPSSTNSKDVEADNDGITIREVKTDLEAATVPVLPHVTRSRSSTRTAHTMTTVAGSDIGTVTPPPRHVYLDQQSICTARTSVTNFSTEQAEMMSARRSEVGLVATPLVYLPPQEGEKGSRTASSNSLGLYEVDLNNSREMVAPNFGDKPPNYAESVVSVASTVKGAR